MKDSNEFNYSYVAPTMEERKEIEAIKRQYMIEENGNLSNIEKLKLLDKKAKRIPKIIFYLLLIIGILVFGLGLTFCLEWNNFAIGLTFGTCGILIGCVSFILKKTITTYFKKKYSKEIIVLSDIILNKSKELNVNL